jgi:hypothetical protein
MNTASYIDIATRIRAEVDAIATIDIYNGQYENSAWFEEYTCPVVFIEFLPNKWVNNNDGSQTGLGGFRLHVLVSLVEMNTRNIDEQTTGQQTAALAPFNVFQQVHDALNNWMPDHGFITPLERVHDEPDHNYAQVMCMRMTYTAEAIDDGTNIFDTGNWTEQALTDSVPDV